jgi:hypothetical protein
MGRVTYVCTTCSEHFTRKYSAKRHNITVHHNNGGEIVTLLEYLVRRISGQYRPSWYSGPTKEKSIHKFGRAMVADSMGDIFRSRGVQREQQYQYHQQSLEEQERYYRQQQEQSVSPSPAAIQDRPPPDVLPYPTDPTFQSPSMNTTDDEKTTTLSQETILKIQELKRLVYKYPQYHYNPNAVIKWATYCSNDGDNRFLDEKLEQLRMIDSVMGYPRM